MTGFKKQIKLIDILKRQKVRTRVLLLFHEQPLAKYVCCQVRSSWKLELQAREVPMQGSSSLT